MDVVFRNKPALQSQFAIQSDGLPRERTSDRPLGKDSEEYSVLEMSLQVFPFEEALAIFGGPECRKLTHNRSHPDRLVRSINLEHNKNKSRGQPIFGVGAAPHPPAGTFSPYSDGEKEAGRDLGAFPATLAIGEIADDSVFLPVTIRGEMSGRTMRGGANARQVSISLKRLAADPAETLRPVADDALGDDRQHRPKISSFSMVMPGVT